MATYDGDVTLSAGLDASDVIETAQSLNEDIEDIFSRSSEFDVSTKFKSLLATLDNLYQKSKAIQEEMDIIAYRESHGLPADNYRYTELTNQLNQVNNQIVITRERLASLNDVDVSEPAINFQKMGSALGQVLSILSQVSSAFIKGASAAIKFSASLSINALKTATKYIENMVKSLLQFTKNSIVSGIEKVKNAISGVGRESKSVDDVLNKAFRTFLKYGLGMRTTFTLIRKIRSAITEGFGNIAQVYEPFNTAMSNLMTAMNGLKGSLSAAFAPLVEFVEPALTRFIYLVSEAVEKIGMLIAALTGKQFIKAVPVQQNYADAAGNTAKNTNNASKAIKNENKEAKELKKTLASFDDINILNEDKDNNNDNDTSPLDTGLDTLQPAVQFETAALENSFKALADKILDIFKSKDWERLGAELAGLVEKGLRKIYDFLTADKVIGYINEITDAITKTFNSFVKNFPADLLGKTVGAAINDYVRLMNRLYDGIDWKNLGRQIAIAVNGLFNEVNTYQLGRLLLQKLNAGIDIATGFLEAGQGHFTAWGEKVNSLFMGALSMINGQKIANVINLAVSAAIDFLSGIRFLALGTQVGKKLRDAIQNIDSGKIGYLIAKVIKSGLDLVKGFLNEMKDTWDKLGTDVGNLLATALKGIPTKEVEDVVSKAMYAILDFLKAGINEFRKDGGFKNLAEKVGGLINVVFADPGKWNEAGEIIRNGFKGALEFLLDLGNIIQWKEIGRNVHDFIKSVMDDDELWDTACENLRTWFKGIVTFIENALPQNPEEWEQIGRRIGQLLEAVPWKEIFDLVIKTIKNAVKGLWEGLGETSAGRVVRGFVALKITWTLLSPLFTAIGSVIVSKATTDYMAKQFASAIGTGLSQAGSDTVVTTAAEAVGTSVSSALGVALGAGVAVAGVVELAAGMQSLSEKAQGLNGELTPLGTTISDVAQYMSDTNVITDEQRRSILLLNDSLENTGATSEEVSSEMATAFEELGLSAEEVDGLWQNATASGNISLEQTQFWESVVSQLPDTVKASNDEINLSNIEVEDSVTKLTDAWEAARGQMGLSEDATNALNGAIGSMAGESLSAQQAYDTLKEKCEALNIPMEALNELFGVAFPEAVDDGSSSVSKDIKSMENNVTKSANNTSDSIKGIGNSTDETKGKVGTFATDVKKDIGNTATDVQQKTAKVYPAIKKVGETATSASGDVSKASSNMSKDFGTATSEMSTSAETHTDEVDTSFSSHFGATVTSVDNNMYAVNYKLGEWMMQIRRNIDYWNGEYETSFSTSWGNIKDTVTTALSGIASDIQHDTQVSSAVASLASDMQLSFSADWFGVGQNICQGIYDGIQWGWDWLTTTAWNLAVEMYNSAAYALGIASPSKKFHWISEMIVEGMVDGLEDNGDMAIDTTDELIQGIIDKAADADPVMTLDTQLGDTTNTLSSILDNYSTVIVDNFTKLIDTLNSIANVPNALAVAQGKVIPYSGMQGSTEDSSSKLDEMIAKLDSLADSAITESQLIDIIRRYLNFSFMIGDEQIARHANAGNAKLDRRFNSLK